MSDEDEVGIETVIQDYHTRIAELLGVCREVASTLRWNAERNKVLNATELRYLAARLDPPEGV